MLSRLTCSHSDKYWGCMDISLGTALQLLEEGLHAYRELLLRFW